MSLNRPVAQCPLLLQSDIVRLHPTLQITNTAVIDAALGATHHALPTAVPLLQLLKRGTTYRELLLAAHRNGCSTAQLRELLGFLQLSGGIERYRQLQTWPDAIIYIARSTLVGVHEPALAHRYRDSPASLLSAVISAVKLVSLVGIIVILLVVEVQQWSFIFGTYVYAYSLAVFVGSIYLHEASHLIMLRKYKATAIIVRQGLRIGILHRKLNAQKELHVSIVGPLAGIMSCLISAAISLSVAEVLLAMISLVIGFIHLCGLLPWYGDGKSIQTARLEKRKAYL